MSNLFDDFDLDVQKSSSGIDYEPNITVLLPVFTFTCVSCPTNCCDEGGNPPPLPPLQSAGCPQSTDCIGGVTRPSVCVALCGQAADYYY